ncbi:unnamed protein product [Chrysoparadoxa australica]
MSDGGGRSAVDALLEVASVPTISKSDEDWVAVLEDFSRAHERCWQLVPTYGIETKALVVQAVLKVLRPRRYDATHHNEDGEEKDGKASGKIRGRRWGKEAEAAALDAIKILLREREQVEELLKDSTIFAYLSAGQDPSNALSQAGLKCLLNSLNGNEAGKKLFVTAGGLAPLLQVLAEQRPAMVHYLAVRNLYHVVATEASGLEALAGIQRGAKPGTISSPVALLCATLAWCVRLMDPPFPRGEGRVLLAAEILKLLFYLRSQERDDVVDEECMPFLGQVIVEALHLPHSQLSAYEVKLQVVNLLMFLPQDFASSLLSKGCLPVLVQILELQILAVTIDKAEACSALTPILAVLNNIAASSKMAREVLKDTVFPEECDAAWRKRLEEAAEAKEAAGKVNGPSAASKQQMHPVDAPPYTLRGRLIGLMTSLEVTSKRYASELLFNLCDSKEEFVVRTGLGNAVAMLRIKGLIGAIPNLD